MAGAFCTAGPQQAGAHVCVQGREGAGADGPEDEEGTHRPHRRVMAGTSSYPTSPSTASTCARSSGSQRTRLWAAWQEPPDRDTTDSAETPAPRWRQCPPSPTGWPVLLGSSPPFWGCCLAASAGASSGHRETALSRQAGCERVWRPRRLWHQPRGSRALTRGSGSPQLGWPWPSGRADRTSQQTRRSDFTRCCQRCVRRECDPLSCGLTRAAVHRGL